MALSGDSPALQTSHLRKKGLAHHFSDLEKQEGRVSSGKCRLDSFNNHWHGMHYYIFTVLGFITLVCNVLV